MNDRVIASKIIQALAKYLKKDASSITEAHHLRDDLGLDSMAVIELLYEIEETFKIEIPDQDLPMMSTVGSVTTYIQQRLAPTKPTPLRTPKKPAPTSKKKKR
jgi:acyl carrier protein